jgi:acetyl esterase/lipase
MPNMTRREMLLAGAAAVAASTVSPAAVAADSPAAPAPPLDPWSLVSPDLRGPLERYRKSTGDYAIDASNLARIRKDIDQTPPLPTPRYEERSIPGPKGAPSVRAFVVNAAPSAKPRPALLYIHGGGYIAGNAAETIPKLQQIARDNDCVAVAADYRLAPETRFPGPLEDNYAVLKWIHDSAKSLGVDPSHIVVMGASAGGGLAAMLTIAARDRGEVPIAFQFLIYPMLDDRTGSARPVPPYIGAYIWVPASNRFGWTSLLGVAAGSRVVPAGAVPARCNNLAGLPPAYIGVGSIDLFVDEDLTYANRLIDSGVSTEICVVPGAYHGFDLIVPDAPISKHFKANWSAVLTKALAGSAKA